MYENMSDDAIEAQGRTATRLRAEVTEHANGWVSGDDGVYEVAMSAEERLAAAAEVVADLQRRLRLADVVIQTLKDTVAERDALLLDFQRRMSRHAMRLALAGGYDHKGKNEVLLSVIASLLAVGAAGGDGSGKTKRQNRKSRGRAQTRRRWGGRD